tara:strand:- start:74 stop:208 length:135 start_codon:yes stop_codon:yes gene_type:complete
LICGIIGADGGAGALIGDCFEIGIQFCMTVYFYRVLKKYVDFKE